MVKSLKTSDDYLRLEEAERVLKEIKEDIFPDGVKISMLAFSFKWQGTPTRSQIVHFLMLIRKTELGDESIHFDRLYASLENICNTLKKRGVRDMEKHLATIELLREVAKDNLNTSFGMGYVVNGKSIDTQTMIDTLMNGTFFHSDLGKVRERKESIIAEDAAIMQAMGRYQGYFGQLENVIRVFDVLKPSIEDLEKARADS